jgi:hypothetical protein
VEPPAANGSDRRTVLYRQQAPVMICIKIALLLAHALEFMARLVDLAAQRAQFLFRRIDLLLQFRSTTGSRGSRVLRGGRRYRPRESRVPCCWQWQTRSC